MLAYSFTESTKAVFTLETIVPLVVVWFTWPVSSLVNFLAVRRLELSTNIIIAQVALVISYIGAVIFFKDQVTLLRVLGAVLVIVATSIIFIQKGSFKNISKQGLMFRLIASTAFAVSGLLDKHNLNNFSVGLYTAAAYTIPGLFLLLISRANFKEYSKEVSANWKFILGLSLASCVAYYCTLKSFGYIDASLTFTIMNFSTVITVIIGVIFFRERKNLLRKFIALILIIVAAVLLNLSL